MDLLLEIENKLNITDEIKNLQENFIQKNWGEAINNAFDIGLKALLPDYMENEIIQVKDAFIKGGLIEAIKKAIEVTINKGKDIIGILSGSLSSVNQLESIAKNGELIKNVSKALQDVVNKAVKAGFISKNLGKIIKAGLKNILQTVQNNIDKINKEQINKTERVEKYIEDWNQYYNERNFSKMQQEYKKLENVLPDVMLTEELANEVETLKNLHNLIKNNGKNFDLTQDELDLAKKLI